ncbi:hypothetical protein SAMN05421870_101698 [Streptomyces qinglanensis]|uniref:Uncharacterized protein n=1 Tax=Streptomyces qinglanensis TaxID=943816 RepID=A0A1H9NVH8_9ACTN|nr:hypothetical protein SAMN05421870_101698 [Streptomyces qinglanensis]
MPAGARTPDRRSERPPVPPEGGLCPAAPSQAGERRGKRADARMNGADSTDGGHSTDGADFTDCAGGGAWRREPSGG